MLSVQISGYCAGPAGLNLVQHTGGGADLPRGAIAALEGVVFYKRSLQRVQVSIIGKPLDGDDLGILMRDGESKATVHAPAIKENGAGAALPVVAALLRAGEP